MNWEKLKDILYYIGCVMKIVAFAFVIIPILLLVGLFVVLAWEIHWALGMFLVGLVILAVVAVLEAI